LKKVCRGLTVGCSGKTSKTKARKCSWGGPGAAKGKKREKGEGKKGTKEKKKDGRVRMRKAKFRQNAVARDDRVGFGWWNTGGEKLESPSSKGGKNK